MHSNEIITIAYIGDHRLGMKSNQYMCVNTFVILMVFPCGRSVFSVSDI